MFRKTKKQCEVVVCNNKLPEDPARIVIDEEFEMLVCDECAKLLEVIEEKVHEILNNEPL